MIILEDYLNEGIIDTVKDKTNRFIDRTKEYGKVLLKPIGSAAGAIGRVGALSGALGASGKFVNHFIGNPLLGNVTSKLTNFGTLALPFTVGAGATTWLRNAFDDARISAKELRIRKQLNAEEDARKKALKEKNAEKDAKDQAIRAYARHLVDNPSADI